jgi:hypothetical protein
VVQAGSVEDAVAKVNTTVLSNITSTENFEPAFCQKGNYLSGIFSIRSSKGLACKNSTIAAIAVIICPVRNIDDYMNSICHKNALIALAGRQPVNVLQQDILNDSNTRDMLCTKTSILPQSIQLDVVQACNN